ncbi:MAG: methionine biosynthesis protein MetW [Verrucomicrobia bacterium]|nr:MAG: methionine biosynthesis protein MetW [Verrucomicrobiota bacterium]
MSDERKLPKSSAKRKIELDALIQWVGEGDRVLDLGCGRGILLNELVRLKRVYAVGVDLDFEKASRAIMRGLSVYHGDILDALSTFPDNSFDWIICSRTLPELDNARRVILESLRVARRVAVGFVNYGYWRNRLAVALTGSRIVNEVFPDSWDASRPTNQISVNSFKKFCAQNDIIIKRSHCLRADWVTECGFLPNLLAGYAIFEIAKRASGEEKGIS